MYCHIDDLMIILHEVTFNLFEIVHNRLLLYKATVKVDKSTRCNMFIDKIEVKKELDR